MGFCVYVHIFPNNKLYIGMTGKRAKDRWDNGNGYNSQRLMSRAIVKYGWKNVKHIILLENLSKEVACECEKYLIAKYQTNNVLYGYNIGLGGQTGGLGLVHSEETRQKISEHRKGKGVGHTVSIETRQKISKANKGKLVGLKLSEERKELQSRKMRQIRQHKKWVTKLNDESRHKLSEALKGHQVSIETRQKISEANTGKQHSEETKQKISEIQRSRSPEERKRISEKMSQSLKKSGAKRAAKRKKTMQERYPNGYKQTEESNRKRSESHKGKAKSEQTKQKMRKPKSPEAIANMKKAQRLRRDAEKLGMSYKEYKAMIGGN